MRDDVEIIVVDDCSPEDKNPLNELVRARFPELNLPNVFFYSTPQGGSAGRARNVGLEHAQGKWLLFADADDFYTEALAEVMDRLASSDSDADIWYFKVRSVWSSDIFRPANRDVWNNYMVDRYLATGDSYDLRINHGPTWPLIIRHQLVKEHAIRFHETMYSNDGFFTCCCGFYARTIAVDPTVIYTITKRPGSLSSTPYWKMSREECGIRMREAIEIDKFLYSQGMPLQDSVFSGVFLNALCSPKIAWEMVGLIHDSFDLSYPFIFAKVGWITIKKSIKRIIRNLK